MSEAPTSTVLSPTLKYDSNSKFITVAEGCFWGVEHIYNKYFSNGKGLIDCKVGYSNGNLPNPSYKRVCEGDTEYAEVLQISYDPSVVTLRELIEFFYKTHDPTTLNSQGRNKGTQYRSAIFYHEAEDLKIIEEVTQEYQAKWGNNITTRIEPIINFYDAEEYHQAYLEKNPEGYHCPTHFVREF
ncbi:hypothetical protein WICPIJ_009056 [Wickerhamomyces pijperi]|uniref:peptide-methionine (S)-S-oxide reductase n=1 Tax=Wickerhamomyces pijperi TaxID=599730 RepID=A0A9P8PRV1_WICPI|nr:hypothetical protein WICPIJ_009056 [Wickerhamomyces pijperi]